jgi:hypothetical protein
MKARVDVNQAGTIIVGANTPGGGWLKEYYFDNASAMHSKCASHDWVERPGGKIVKGSEYTERMARNDFNKISK